MKAERNFARAIVTPKGERWLAAGHIWVYAEEIVRMEGEWENGDIIDVLSGKGKYLGTGFLSEKSKIRVRLFSRNASDVFDDAFWERRLRYAWEYRRQVLGGDVSACRVIFGESDSFPGLTVDRFGDILVTQTLSIGMERLKARLFPLIVRVLREEGEEISGIFERNDVPIRLLEGLEEGKGWFPLMGEKAPDKKLTLIRENGIEYEVDFIEGQKTGFFLDQRENRLAVARLARGKKVLDCFTHTGSFALNAAMGGAESVTAVDISVSGIEMAKENARRNGLADKMEFVTADIFDFLPSVPRGTYDFIILDPPAFTKSRRTVSDAGRGYKEINLRAMKALPRGGYLATCSCSHFFPAPLFEKMLREAALDAGVSLRQIEARQQSPDHPILWNVPETDYLKFYLFQIV